LNSVKQKVGDLKSLRGRARLAPRAAREVNAENQNLDGHGPMVVAEPSNVKHCKSGAFRNHFALRRRALARTQR
jgi:hypothetical protein